MTNPFSNYRELINIFPFVSALLAMGFVAFPAMSQDTDGTGGEEDLCWEEWTLCEGSIPCPVEICVKDIIASIECSIDDSCDEEDETKIPRVVATKLQYELSKPGGVFKGRRGHARAQGHGADDEVVCWEVGNDIVCENLSTILGDCWINADCEEHQQSEVPREVLNTFRVLYAGEKAAGGSGSKWSYSACCKSCDCSVIPCTCTGCSDDNTGSCGRGLARATCESDGNGTTCLDWDPQALEGCCVYCPPGQYCQHCASATHDTCGALIKASCGLINDEFSCNPAHATLPVDLRLSSPDLVRCMKDERTGKVMCRAGTKAEY